jgi:hypothetical protein
MGRVIIQNINLGFDGFAKKNIRIITWLPRSLLPLTVENTPNNTEVLNI